MSKSQRTKGANGEREICRLLFKELGIDAKRNLSQTREGGCDISVGTFDIEVKRRKRIGQVYDWINQVQEASADPHRTPVVFARADGKEWLSILPLSVFLEIMREMMAAEEAD